MSKKKFNELDDNKNITIGELTNKLNVSMITVKRNIKLLKGRRIINRIGSSRGGRWEINK